MNISRRDGESLDFNAVELAHSIANEFNTIILLELNEENCEWCLIDRVGVKHAVSILEINDGLSVNEKAGRFLLG